VRPARACRCPSQSREEDAHAAGVEFVDYVANAGDAAGQVANHVELVAVVYSKIGIEPPDENGVDGAEASFQASATAGLSGPGSNPSAGPPGFCSLATDQRKIGSNVRNRAVRIGYPKAESDGMLAASS
jgi:hypothetical protein